jgi:tungstate transport system substrate-binding protein
MQLPFKFNPMVQLSRVFSFRKLSFIVLSLVLLAMLVILPLTGCSSTASPATTAPVQTTAAAATTVPPTTPAVTAPKPANPDMILATTTSTQDSGLLGVLLPVFEQRTGYKVKTIAVGSGAAMTMGERGEADVLLVHAPDSEVTFMKAAHGVDRKLVMHNDFIIVGPSGDQAGIKGMTSAVEALKKIAASGRIFVSRGDNSGTDQLEKKLWKSTPITPKGQSWYQETGQGMGATLTVASEKEAYTITDRATYLSSQKNLRLDILVQGDPVLLNIYHVIQVNPNKSDKINAAGAKAFAEFMVARDIQEMISKYGIDKYGAALFFPDAGKTEADLGSV